MKLWHAPLGKIIVGHVLDVSLKPFARALRDYDKQLYVTWNQRKLQGHGCWEIRRLPNQKKAVYQGSFEGKAYYKIGYVEYSSIHHVLDCAFLNYDVIRKIKEIDMYRIVKESGYVTLDALLDAKQKSAAEKQTAKASENLRLQLRDNKSALRDFYGMVQSGIHPSQVLKSIKWVHNS